MNLLIYTSMQLFLNVGSWLHALAFSSPFLHVTLVVGDCGFHSTLFTKRLLTVNTIVLYEVPKANLKVMDP